MCEVCGGPTHRDDSMNRRCNGCERLTRMCTCSRVDKDFEKLVANLVELSGLSEEEVRKRLDDGEGYQYFPSQQQGYWVRPENRFM